MSHDVKIDDEGIASAFDNVASGGSAAPGAAPGPAPEVLPPAAEAWAPVTGLLASILSNKVCPAWEVPPEIRQQWADALGECLDQLLPGGLGNIGAWGPWGKLAFASSVWIMAGLDLETMTLKPRYPQDENDQAAAGDQRQARSNSGGFKTDA